MEYDMKKHHFLYLCVAAVLLITCAKNEFVQPLKTGSFGDALQSHLSLVKNKVAEITDPVTGDPVDIPHFDLIYKTAGNIMSYKDPETALAIAYSLLGRASDVDCKYPDHKKALRFPGDHHIDSEMGFEWYYFGTYLNVKDQHGNIGRIGLLLSMQKQRVIGLTTQQEYGMTDNNCMMFVNLVTATIKMNNNKKIIRRSANYQLPALGGAGGFSEPGEDFFMSCGSDALKGGRDVLPLTATVKDGNNLDFEMTFIPPEGMKEKHAFFKQGMPNLRLKGTGYTYDPSPGIYYSWPHLKVDTSKEKHLIVDGISYTILNGEGWMDHQLMMQSLKNMKNETHPIPFIEDYEPYHGWSWFFFNLENGHSFTGASFQNGKYDPDPTIVYGYHIWPNKNMKRWESTYIWGTMHLKDMQDFPVMVDDPASPQVLLPTTWGFEDIQNIHGDLFNGTASPWLKDGSFNGQTRQLIAENPVDYLDVSGKDLKGSGFCESVGFEHVNTFTERAVEYLKSKP